VSGPGSVLLVFAALVLATERLVTGLKTVFPIWLEDERKNTAGEVDLVADRPRRLRVQALAFAAALALARGIAGPAAEAVEDTGSAGGARVLPLVVVALATCGAAAFWTQCIQRLSAAKDATVTRRTLETLRFRRHAEARGVDPVDSGRAVRPARPSPADRRGRLLLQLHAHAPDNLTSPASGTP
jgi:hypothetical protein